MSELNLDIAQRIPPQFKNALSAYAVNVPDVITAKWQPLYSRLVYDALGQTELRFFSQSAGANGVTEEDTNMQTPNMLSSPIYHLGVGLRFDFKPTIDIAQMNAAAAADLEDYINDVQAVYRSGFVEFSIGTKDLLQEAPLGRFPPSNHLNVQAALADTSTAGANQLSGVTYAQNVGMPYQITPVIIPHGQTFNLSAKWAAALPLPSGVDGTLTAYIDGWEFSLAQ